MSTCRSRRHSHITIELWIISRTNSFIKHMVVSISSIHWNFISRSHNPLFVINRIHFSLLLQRCLMSSDWSSSCQSWRTNTSLVFFLDLVTNLWMIIQMTLIHQSKRTRFLRIRFLLGFHKLWVFKVVAPCWVARSSLNLIEVRPRGHSLNRHYNTWLQLLIEKLIDLIEVCAFITRTPTKIWIICRSSDSILSQLDLRLRIRVKQCLFLICNILFWRWSAIISLRATPINPRELKLRTLKLQFIWVNIVKPIWLRSNWIS